MARARKCRVCGRPFVPTRPLQPVCETFTCRVAYADRAAAKSKAKREKAERQADRDKRLLLAPRKVWIRKLKAVMHLWVRLRDEGKTCISCDTILVRRGKTGGNYDAGHYRSVSSAKHLEFDERNIHGQCKHCNRFLAGNPHGYRRGLRARLGDTAVEQLEADQAPRRYSIAQLQALIALYHTKIRALRAAQPSGVPCD